MRKLLLLFIILFPCLNIYSQNLSYLFQNDLPKDTHKYFTDQSVNDILIRDVELNPGILYWHLIYLKELVENKNMDNDKNGLNSIKKLAILGQLEKNNFLEEVKAEAGQNRSDEFKGKIIDILADYILSSTLPVNQNYKIPEFDTNKMYFVTAKYLSGDRKLSYNKDEIYQTSIKQLETKAYIELKQKLSDMKNQQGNITVEYLECLIKNWWLVKNNPGITNDLSSAIREYIDQNYSIRKIGKLDIIGGYSYTFEKEWFSYDFMSPINHNSDHISEMKNFQSLGLQVDYKVILKELMSFLAYIDFGLGGSIASGPSSNHDAFTSYERYNTIDDNNFSSVYFAANNIKLSNEKCYSIFGKVSIPVLMVTPELILHAGVMAGMSFTSADLSYLYTIRNGTTTWTWNGGYQYVSVQNDLNVPRTNSISRHVLNISPIVELNLNLLQNVLVKFTTSGYNFFSINAGVEL
jgi:hypothetical protein